MRRRIDSLERRLRRLERRHPPGLVRRIESWRQEPDGTYTNREGVRVKRLPRPKPGVLQLIIRVVKPGEVPPR